MQGMVNFAHEKGFKIKDITLDGAIKRLDRDGDKNAWYVGFEIPKVSGSGNFTTAVFGDWKTGEKYIFKGDEKLSRDDLKRQKEIYRQAIAKAEAERREGQELAARRASDIYGKSLTTGGHEYLTRKKIKGLHGSRISEDQGGKFLVVPMMNIENEIRGLQKIYSDKKLFLPGQENKGNFFIIGEIRDDTKKVYLCEGFATGATIHMATHLPVVCAFSANNLKNVAVNIKKKWPQLFVIVAADNDKSGVGEKAGDAAASAVMGSVVIPHCSNGTDFNDLYIEKGSLDAVKSALEPMEELPDSGFIPLGHAANNSMYYFFKQSTNTIIEISGFSENDLLKLQPSFLWKMQFPTFKGGIDKQAATDYLIEMSEKAGIFDSTKQRGLGCWRDGSDFIYNSGRKLFDNKNREITYRKSSYVYTNSAFSMLDKPLDSLTDKESMYLEAACTGFNWKGKKTGELLAGWLALARVAALLPKRYHVWITGSSDTGKTDVMEKLVRFAIGEDAHAYFKGATTEAGVRQTVNNSTVPVVFDEFESDGHQSIDRVTHIIELLRIAYDGGKVTKGSTSGTAQDFIAAFPAIVSSIRMALDNDADRSRFFQCELQPLNKDQQARAAHYEGLLKKIEVMHGVDYFADRLFWRSFRNIETILGNYQKLRKAFSSKCQKSRTVAMFALLAAGHYSLISAGSISDGAAQDYADGFDFGDEPETDESLCLGHLLATKLRVVDSRAKGMSDAIVYEEYTIGELAGMAADGKEINWDQQKSLERHGVKVHNNFLCISRNSATIKSRYKDTKWARSFADVLKRVNTQKTEDQKEFILRFNGKNDRTITIPMTYFNSAAD